MLTFILWILLHSPTRVSHAEDTPPSPSWISQPTRTVDNGYIVYVGSGEDSSPERARLKAEGVAIQDLANECSFPPKGARIEDSFDSVQSSNHKTYVKLGIQFSDCIEAQKTIAPDAVRAMASQPMTDELKRYQDLIDEPVTVASNSKPLDLPSPAQSPSNHTSSDVVVVGASSGPPPMGGYWFWRQQVAYQKEVVILNPTVSYAPTTPEGQSYSNTVNPYTQKIMQYQKENPGVMKSSQTWSNIPDRPHIEKPQALAPAKPKPVSFPKNPGGEHPGGYHSGGSHGGGAAPSFGRRKKHWY